MLKVNNENNGFSYINNLSQNLIKKGIDSSMCLIVVIENNLFDNKLVVGNLVKHIRFGTGEVLKIEGTGADVKAEINFQHGGVKKLLLRFAKLEVIG